MNVRVVVFVVDLVLVEFGLAVAMFLAQAVSVRGVNLDEEAANMVRFQQLYQAAAQTMAIANSLFNTLLGVLGR